MTLNSGVFHPRNTCASAISLLKHQTNLVLTLMAEQETLRYHHQHTPDIILHSSEPKTSPHIIISAPYEDAWSGMVSAEMNRLNPQCPEGLTVPHCIPWEPPVEQAVEVDGFEADASSGPALVYLRRVTNEQVCMFQWYSDPESHSFSNG